MSRASGKWLNPSNSLSLKQTLILVPGQHTYPVVGTNLKKDNLSYHIQDIELFQIRPEEVEFSNAESVPKKIIVQSKHRF